MDEASLMMMVVVVVMMIGKTKNGLDKETNKESYMVLQYMYCNNRNHLKISRKISEQHTWKA
jgi:hypothetical protein